MEGSSVAQRGDGAEEEVHGNGTKDALIVGDSAAIAASHAELGVPSEAGGLEDGRQRVVDEGLKTGQTHGSAGDAQGASAEARGTGRELSELEDVSLRETPHHAEAPTNSTAAAVAPAEGQNVGFTPAEKRKNMLFMLLSAMFVIAAILVGVKFGSKIFNAIIDAKDFLQDEPLSLLGYFSIFTFMSMVFVPYSPFCIAIGFIFGIYWGLLIEMFNILISSSVIFLVGRHLFKDYVEGVIAKSNGSTATVWKGLIKYMGRDWKEAAKINLLCCFIPMPYGMNRYLFSLTNVPFIQYNFFFMIGMIPNTFLNLLIGAALSEASGEGGIDAFRLIGTGVGIVGIMSAIWYAKIVAHKVVAESNKEDAEEGAGPGVVGDGKRMVHIRVNGGGVGAQGVGGLQAVIDEETKSEDLSITSVDGGSSHASTTVDTVVNRADAASSSVLPVKDDSRKRRSWPQFLSVQTTPQNQEHQHQENGGPSTESGADVTSPVSSPSMHPRDVVAPLHRRVYTSLYSPLRAPLSRYVQLSEDRVVGQTPVVVASTAKPHANSTRLSGVGEAGEEMVEVGGGDVESESQEAGLLRGQGLDRSDGTRVSELRATLHTRNHSWPRLPWGGAAEPPKPGQDSMV